MFRRGGPLTVSVVLAGCSLFVLDEGEFTGGRVVDTADGGQDAAEERSGDGPGDGAAGPDAPVTDEAGADASTSRYAETILADGPILYLRFGETSGSVAKALVGTDGAYAVAGIALGAPGALTGDDDTAVTLTDGAGQVVVHSTNFAFEGAVPFSVEIWAKPAATNTDLGFVVDHTEYDGVRRGWSLFVGADGVAYDRWASTEIRSSLRQPPLTPGVWHHVVGTFDGTKQRLYADGVRIAEVTSGVELPSRASVLTIGKQSCDCGAGNSFVGALDELAIYDKALTEMQIAAHLAAAK